MSGTAVVGKELPKFDAAEKVTGRAVYIHDLELPGMLWGKILYSDRVSARIVRIDTSEAEKVPGVKAVLTGENTPEIRFGFLKDNIALKKDRVRQYRDEIAAVAATTREAAEEALGKIRVEYEDLPALFSIDDAMAPGAPLVHETDLKGKPLKDNRLRLPWKIESGDLGAGEAASAFTAEGEYDVGWVSHCCLGTSGCVASFDTAGNLTMYSSTQIPSLAKAEYLEAVKILGRKGRVRVVNAVVGGGFGSKLDTYAFEYIAILLADRTKRPVKILFEREEEFIATSPRQPAKVRIRQGCDKEGRLTFRDVSMVLDNGAYTSWGATTPTVAMMPSTSLYRVPNVRFEAACIYTNNTYAQAMRGYGTPQVTFALETNLDELAEKAGIDPYEFRLRNANQQGDVTPQGFHLNSCGHAKCLEEVGARLGLGKPRKERAGGRKVRGFGLACLMHVGGGAKIYKSDGCGTLLKMDDQGRVDVFSGSMDIGQGLDTVLRQIVAETLGLPVADVNVVIGDTDVCPWDVGVHASRSTFIAGNSALGAAKIVRDQLLSFAEDTLEVPKEILKLQGGMVVCAEDASKNTPLEKILRKAHYASHGNTMFMAAHFYEPPTELLSGNFKGDFSCAYAWGCHGAEVEVDTETGKIEVLRYVAAHDVGKAINPLLLKGQIYGGGLMGIGYALSEEMVYEKGRLLNPNFRDYKILTARDAVPVEPVIVETENPAGPYGAKGIGEPGLVPTAPAIANAIYDAVGIRLRKLPMKPEDVLEALARKRAER
ncbi:MAG: xanthine dehydrogenase family protein molybdopterin-binding subunit [Deltaproteobacteria bacterium]|nr:xanthine dehydrogenase family protein molybdopterin-binding subunit [Deltaproteobacteria bacterium]